MNSIVSKGSIRRGIGSIAGKVVAITGASSGIGAALARLATAQGAYVIMGARRRDRLAWLADEIGTEQCPVRYRQVDVTRQHDVQAFVDYAVAECGRLDVMINNAGVMLLSPFSALRVEDWGRMIDVNLRGTLHGIAAALPVMQQQASGHIINLTMAGGSLTSSEGAIYAATKAAVRAISEGLRLENDQIRVTMVSPGITDTELAQRIADPVIRCETRARRSIAVSADDVARAILFAMEQPVEVDVSEIAVRPRANPFSL
jgi:NADP-dependent 3-hydroxy acid dehydrogenase YdfG